MMIFLHLIKTEFQEGLTSQQKKDLQQVLSHFLGCIQTWRPKFITQSKKHTVQSCVLLKLSLMRLLGYLPSLCLHVSVLVILMLFVNQPLICCHVCLFQEKESLITELRKELRVSDDEHRELLTKVNSDDIISKIRFASSKLNKL